MTNRIRQFWNQRKPRIVILVLLASGVLFGAVRYSNRSPSVPTLVVTRGDFIDSLQFRGEVKARRSMTIVTPANAGEFWILKIAADGTAVKQGDVVVEFDKTKTEQDLEQYRSALKSAQAEIDQARAQTHLTEEEDRTAVMKAKYDVEAAKLDAGKQEILSKIEGAEANLKLADAEQKLRELEENEKSDQASSQATVDSKIQASRKATYDVQRAQHSLTTMTLQAPLAGTISLVSVWRNSGESPFKAGDRTWPGAPLAELPDVSALRISSRLEETDRGRVALGQKVTVHIDAISDREFTGKIESISTIASSDFSGGWPFPRNFDCSIALDQTDAKLKPGMTAQVTVIVDKVLEAIAIPAQAVFQKSDQTVAYVWTGSTFQARTIDVGRRNGDRVLIVKGLHPDDRVALTDPTTKE